MNDLISSIRFQLNERLNSPFLGAYAFAWLTFNYKFVLLVFSELGVEEKFRLIDSLIFADNWSAACRFLVPLAVSVAYILLSPFPVRWAMIYTQKQNNLNKKEQVRINEERAMTQEDARAYRAVVDKDMRENNEAFEGLTKELQRVKHDLMIGGDAVSDLKAKLIEKDEEILGLKNKINSSS